MLKKRVFRKLYKDLFYIPKREKLSHKVFRCRMVVSLLTILACTAVMAASTLALFYMDVSTDKSAITSAYYSVTVDNTDDGTYICPLAFEDKHTFKIKADGTATTGYCKIRVGEQVYYTEQIPRGASFTLTVQAAKDTPIVFTPQWGTPSKDICGNEILHSSTPSVSYIVEPTAKLADVAAHYGVSEADILTYNNISDIIVGTELKIPGIASDATPYTAPCISHENTAEESTAAVPYE